MTTVLLHLDPQVKLTRIDEVPVMSPAMNLRVRLTQIDEPLSTSLQRRTLDRWTKRSNLASTSARMSPSASPKKRVTWDDQMFPNPVVRYRDQVPEGEQRVLRN